MVLLQMAEVVVGGADAVASIVPPPPVRIA
jgi:hypothetical protein